MSKSLEEPQGEPNAAQHAPIEAQAHNIRKEAAHHAAAEESESTHKQTEEHLKLFRTLLDNSSDSIEVLDPVTVCVLDVNETECRELGYSREELLSMRISDIDSEFDEGSARQILQQIRRAGCVRFDSVHQRKDGSTFPVEVSAKLIEIDKPYMVCIVRDVTERKLMEERQRVNEQRLQLAVKCGQMGVWDLDLVSHIACQTLGYDYIFGYDSLLPQWTFEMFMDHVLPEDRIEVSRLFNEAVLKQADWNLECRVRRVDGEVRWIWVNGTPHHDDDGVVRRMIGVVQDITDRKMAAEAVAASEKKFRDLVESVSDWVWEVDNRGMYVYCSPRVKNLLGYDPAELIGKSPFDLMPAAEAARMADLFSSLIAEKRPLEGLENTNLHKDGHVVIMETSGSPVFDADGTFKGYRGIDRDITVRKKLERELERQARTDVLTGLTNRRHFFELAEKELARAKRHGGRLSVLMLDVDHFKLFNDTYGHHVGDRVLQKLSEVCVHTLRTIDMPGRIGGEEFAVLLPETQGDQALEVAERLRLAIADATVPLEQSDASVHFTVSIGVTSFVATDIQMDDMLKRADTALYTAKNAGRNQVCRE